MKHNKDYEAKFIELTCGKRGMHPWDALQELCRIVKHHNITELFFELSHNSQLLILDSLNPDLSQPGPLSKKSKDAVGNPKSDAPK